MGCNRVKCSNTNCATILPACQMIQGMCPTCYTNKNQKQQNNTVNVFNQSFINKNQSRQ